MEFIWDKLTELVSSGELKTIIENNDSAEGMFPVYSCPNGVIKKQFADIFGYPNITHNGEMMYENTFFKTEQEAIKYGIEDMGYAIKNYSNRIYDMEKETEQRKAELSKCIGLLENLKSQSK